jgi:hypothetical protein
MAFPGPRPLKLKILDQATTGLCAEDRDGRGSVEERAIRVCSCAGRTLAKLDGAISIALEGALP